MAFTRKHMFTRKGMRGATAEFPAGRLDFMMKRLSENYKTKFVIGRSAEAELNMLNADAAYLPRPGGPGRFLFRSNATYHEVWEELKHFSIHRTNGWSHPFSEHLANIHECEEEITVQQWLLVRAATNKWDRAAYTRITDRLDKEKAKLKKLKGQ